MIFAVDSGLANMGWAIVTPEKDKPRCVALGVIRTEKSDRKRNVGAADDLVRRTHEVWLALDRVFKCFNPSVVAAESFSPPRNASNAAKTAIALGQVIAHAAQRALPIVQASPQEVKKAVTSSKSASKDEVEAAVAALYKPTSPDLWAAEWRAVPESLRNHAWDALAVACSTWNTEVVKLVRRRPAHIW